ncbi:MAG: glycosyltransferase family 2 protein [Enhydrobacter sp.]|nr:glycosyltransferase family 2 protein [Enhydrobacter sp.]
MSDKVSVIIPCYNAARHVAETLESVRRQTSGNIEVIVVDDGSTDDSARIVEGFGGLDLVLVRQANRGQSAALNVGLAHATGDYIQYLDADDLIDPDKIAIQLARLRQAPRCVASSCWGRFYRRPADARFEIETVSCDLDSLDWLVESRADGLEMMFPALWLVPVAIARAAGPWREDLTLNNDAEYFTRVLLAADRVLYCEHARCRYRSGVPGSMSGRKTPAHWISQEKVIELCQQRVLARDDGERARRGFSLSWQRLAHACYPYHRPLAERAMTRARALHPDIVLPGGGPAFLILSRLIGWRAARRLQVATGRP